MTTTTHQIGIPNEMTPSSTSTASICLETLYKEYNQKLFNYCQKIIGNRQDAYDVSTDAFLKATENIHQLKNAHSFGFWLFRIAHNDCMDFLKSRQKKRSVLINEDLFSLPDEAFNKESALEKEALFVKMETSMAKVNSKTRRILTEKYLENKTVAELEEEYGLTESAVKMRLSRARKKVLKMAG